MPYKEFWLPNELVLQHNGFKIFRTYKNDDAEPLNFHFGTAEDTSVLEGDATLFDVRDLPTWTDRHENLSEQEATETAIRAAIDSGDLAPQLAAAHGRPTRIYDHLPITLNLDRPEFGPGDFLNLLSDIHGSLLARLVQRYRELSAILGDEITLAYPVYYTSDTEYTIIGIRAENENPDELTDLLYRQEEDGCLRPEEWYVSFLESEVVANLLHSMEQQLNELK
jgi:hypothetical protein